jgi:hypothetical protein
VTEKLCIPSGLSAVDDTAVRVERLRGIAIEFGQASLWGESPNPSKDSTELSARQAGRKIAPVLIFVGAVVAKWSLTVLRGAWWLR